MSSGPERPSLILIALFISDLGLGQNVSFGSPPPDRYNPLPTSTLEGRILGTQGQPVPNVSVSLTGPTSRFATTDASGFFSFGGLQPGGPYTITPSSSGSAFSPPSASMPTLPAGVAATTDFSILPCVNGAPSYINVNRGLFLVRYYT
jgi:hypothetical protein